MWLRILEAYLTARLIQSQTFQRMVTNLAIRIQHKGRLPPSDGSELGGTACGGENVNDQKGIRDFLKIYAEELKAEFKDDKRKR